MLIELTNNTESDETDSKTHYRNGNLDGYRCSTITLQTANNIFTLGTHTGVRKVVETWWTVIMGTILGKERILEVHLNIAEFGPGIFGVSDESHAYFPHLRLTGKRLLR